MGASKHIKMALVDNEMTTDALASKLGKPIQSFYNQMHRDTWKFAEVEKVADLLDCDVVLVNRKTGKLY